jgi:Protein of unknown function (DUF3592)
MKKLILALFHFVIILAGLILLGIFITRIPSLGLFGEAHRTTGVVVEINTETESGESFQVPRVQFTTENGQQITVVMICTPFDCFSNYGIGSRVPVIYPNNFPEFAIAGTLMGRLWTPLFLLLMSVVCTLYGSLYLAMLIGKRGKGSSTSM